jgi:hypothetical protein
MPSSDTYLPRISRYTATLALRLTFCRYNPATEGLPTRYGSPSFCTRAKARHLTGPKQAGGWGACHLGRGGGSVSPAGRWARIVITQASVTDINLGTNSS